MGSLIAGYLPQQPTREKSKPAIHQVGPFEQVHINEVTTEKTKQKSLRAKIARKLLRNRDRVAGFWLSRLFPPKIHSHFIRTV
jgi:hypothetical protein